MSERQIQQLSFSLGKQLKEKSLWLTCAESCTGGGFAKAITDIAGSSAYFDRGFITYSNLAKQQLVGVSGTTLAEYGAVSKEVVLEMAYGALHAAKASLAVAISGIAGPDGGSIEKPVGTVWFGFAGSIGPESKDDDINYAICRNFIGDRISIRQQAVSFALQELLDKFL